MKYIFICVVFIFASGFSQKSHAPQELYNILAGPLPKTQMAKDAQKVMMTCTAAKEYATFVAKRANTLPFRKQYSELIEVMWHVHTTDKRWKDADVFSFRYILKAVYANKKLQKQAEAYGAYIMDVCIGNSKIITS